MDSNRSKFKTRCSLLDVAPASDKKALRNKFNPPTNTSSRTQRSEDAGVSFVGTKEKEAVTSLFEGLNIRAAIKRQTRG